MKWFYGLLFIAIVAYLVAPGKVNTVANRGSIAGGAGMF